MRLKRLTPFWVSVLVIIVVSVAGIPIALAGGSQDVEAFESEIYAEHFGVTVDEAVRRFELQDIIGELDAEVTAREAETFAGLWIEHTPEYKVVVLFTRYAEETIAPYLQSYPELAGIIEVRTAEMSLSELRHAQNEASSAIRALGIPLESEIDVYTNRVKVYVADEVRFNNAIKDGELVLPDCVEVVIVESMGGVD